MFFAVNKVNTTDAERIVAYQLFEIAKRLTSGQLLYLKACYELFRTGAYAKDTVQPIRVEDWMRTVGNQLGHGVLGLLEKDDIALMQHGLVIQRQTHPGATIHTYKAHLTDLGITFCENIQTYEMAAKGQATSE
jgi:hypothetical protein